MGTALGLLKVLPSIVFLLNVEHVFYGYFVAAEYADCMKWFLPYRSQCIVL